MTNKSTIKDHSEGQFQTPKILPPVIFLLAAISLLTAGFLETGQFGTSLLGLPIALGAIGLASWEKKRFATVGTTIFPGKDASKLITDGAFRFSRNPMYLAMVIALMGLWPLTGGYSPALVIVVFAAIILHRFILKEEQHMLSLFGTEYENYKHRVRRWI